MPKRNINDNPIQSHYDNKFNGIKNAEENGSFPGVGDKPGVDGVRDAESNPGKDWKNNVVGKSLSKNGGPMSFIKTKSPMLAIIIALVGGGFGMIGLSSSALLPMSIVSNLVQKFNTQETSLTIRTNKLFASKMANDNTSGICTNFIEIACRFTSPSNRFLTQLEDNGIKAFNEKGQIESGGLFPNARPDVYQFTNEAGESTYIQASELKQTLIDNPEFRDAFHEASKTRFESLSDSVFDFVKTKFGFNTSDQLASATDEAAVEAEATSASSLGDSSVSTAAGEGGAAVSSGDVAAESAAFEEVLQPEEQALTDEFVAAGEGGGGAVSIVGAIVCTAADVPGMITKAARDFQMLQLIKYSAIFLSAFGAIKAGDAKPEEVSAIGKVLTEVVGGKSAMDSFGMRNVMHGDVIPQNNSFKTFSPGALVMSKMGAAASIADNETKKNACAVAINPATGQAINVALAGTGAGLGAAVVNVLAGVALAKVAETILPWVLSSIIKLIPVDKIMGFFMGDLTKGLTGEAVGDALTSGASHTMGQTASSGGNVPLSVTDAVAYNEETKKVQLAYAEEDRATKSPFDITSPNTMMGSIVQKLLPYYVSSSTGLGSISSGIATIGKIVTGSFSTILQPYTANAASPEQQYQLCDDPTIKDNNIAAGPFCNIIYGVPTKYLDKDPVTIVNSLIVGGGKYAGNVDKDTGEPVPGSDLDKWIKACTDGKSDQAKNCEIADDKTASFALYTIDHRIQKSMDDEPSVATKSSSSSSSSSSSTTTVSAPIDGAATICIDAGHPPNGAGGEPALTLKVAKDLQTELEGRGYNVIMTRTTSSAVSISDRPAKCLAGKANFMYSLHADGSTKSGGYPYQIYMEPNVKGAHKVRKMSSTSKSYATTIQKAVAKEVSGFGGLKDGGLEPESYTYRADVPSLGIFSGADDGGLPAVLTEMVQLKNGHSTLDDANIRKKLVTGIANGIQSIFPIKASGKKLLPV